MASSRVEHAPEAGDHSRARDVGRACGRRHDRRRSAAIGPAPAFLHRARRRRAGAARRRARVRGVWCAKYAARVHDARRRERTIAVPARGIPPRTARFRGARPLRRGLLSGTPPPARPLRGASRHCPRAATLRRASLGGRSSAAGRTLRAVQSGESTQAADRVDGGRPGSWIRPGGPFRAARFPVRFPAPTAAATASRPPHVQARAASRSTKRSRSERNAVRRSSPGAVRTGTSSRPPMYRKREGR